MNSKQRLLRAALLSCVTSYGATACVRSPQCETRPAPNFASVITSSFLLENIKSLSGISGLTAVQSGAATSTGYTFALPGSETPEGESYVVTIDYSARRTPTTSNGCSPVVPDAGAGSCVRDLQQLPFSAGSDGSYRAIKFTTIDARYDVQLGVFEKLEDTTASHPLELERVASKIADRYCASVGARAAEGSKK